MDRYDRGDPNSTPSDAISEKSLRVYPSTPLATGKQEPQRGSVEYVSVLCVDWRNEEAETGTETDREEKEGG